MSSALIFLAAVLGGNPAANIPPSPDFWNDCSGTSYDNSTACTNTLLEAIAHARASEQLPAMVLPSNWYGLSQIEQLFVTANLERTVRKLPPLEGLAVALDMDAQGAAVADGDPTGLPNGFPSTSAWGGNWAFAEGSALWADYLWMYDDGLNPDGTSLNLDCSKADQSGCWGHRDNILGSYPCTPCVMGAGYALDGAGATPDWTELFVGTSGAPKMDFSWSQETPYFGTSSGGTDGGSAADGGTGDGGMRDGGSDDGSGGGCGSRGGLNSISLFVVLLLCRSARHRKGKSACGRLRDGFREWAQ